MIMAQATHPMYMMIDFNCAGYDYGGRIAGKEGSIVMDSLQY